MALTVDGLRVSITTDTETVDAVSDISLTLPVNSTLGLLGASGSGKTVTALSILGLTPGGRRAEIIGSIRLGGIELTRLSEEELRHIRGRQIAMVFQDPAASLTPVHKVGKLLEDTVRANLDLPSATIGNRALQLLTDVGFPDPELAANSYVQELSGGMKQRVMIATALAGEPSILIADEPTSALDAIARGEILDLIGSIQESRAISVLMISHDLSVMTRMADQIVVVEDGKTIEQAETRKLLADPRHPGSRVLVEANKTDPVSGSSRGPSTPESRGSAVGDGPMPLVVEQLEMEYPRQASSGAGRGTIAVRGASLSIAPGEILGLVGESGCGKTTLARCVLRILEPTGGRILIAGDDVTNLSQRDLRPLRDRVSAVFQSPGGSLNPRHTVERILRAPLKTKRSRDRRASKSLVAEALESVELGPQYLQRRPHQLSGGQQQRVALARALIVKPRLLICDEPFTALDVPLQDRLARLLRDLQLDSGLSCLFIAHDLRVVRQIADRVAVMRDGRITETGETGETFAMPENQYTKALVAAAER